VEHIVREERGIVRCRVGQVVLEHLHHVTHIVVVLGELRLETCRVQEIAFADAGRDLINLRTQISLATCLTAFRYRSTKLSMTPERVSTAVADLSKFCRVVRE
jgi:hypothetical protein